MTEEPPPPHPPVPDELEEEVRRREAKSRRWIFLVLVVCFVCVALLHRLLMTGGIGQSAAMFIGLPALMAIGLSFVPRGRTITGAIMWNMTFTLLLLGILLIEGFICLLMAAPLFYLVGLIIGICADRSRVQRDMARFRCVAVLVFGLMAVEGIVPALSFGRENVVVRERAVPGTVAEVRERLLAAPELDPGRLPGFLRLGFPTPAGIEREGEDGWRIFFDEGGDEPTELLVRCSEPRPGVIRYRIEEDDSKISEWLTWHEGVWELREAASGGVEVTLTVRYRRELDPAWYFGPLERHGVRLAADYFADELLRDGADDES